MGGTANRLSQTAEDNVDWVGGIMKEHWLEYVEW